MPKLMQKAIRHKTLEHVARMILKGRIGRACRILARETGATPLALGTDAERIAWAEQILKEVKT